MAGVNVKGRSTGKLKGRDKALFGPPPDQLWAFTPLDLLASTASRRQTAHCASLVQFLVMEHFDHGRLESGRLVATYDQLSRWGIPRARISETLREAVYLGLVRVTSRGGINGQQGGKVSSLYRLTMYATHDRHPPSNDWKRLEGKDAEIRAYQKANKARRRGLVKGAIDPGKEISQGPPCTPEGPITGTPVHTWPDAELRKTDRSPGTRVAHSSTYSAWENRTGEKPT